MPGSTQQVHLVNIDPDVHAGLAWLCKKKHTTISTVVRNLLYLAATDGAVMQQCITIAPRKKPESEFWSDIIVHHVDRVVWQNFRVQARAYGSSPQMAARGMLALFAEDNEKLIAKMGVNRVVKK